MSNIAIDNSNNLLTSDPDCDIVDELFQGFAQFLVLENTLKTSLFDCIEREVNSVTVASLSSQYGFNADVLGRLLDNLTSMQLIDKYREHDTWRYSNSRAVSMYLTRRSKFYKGDALLAGKDLVWKLSGSFLHTLESGPQNQMETFILSGNMSNLNAELTDGESDENENMNRRPRRSLIDNNSGPKGTDLSIDINTTDNRQTRSIENAGKSTVKDMMKSMDAMMYSCRLVIPKTFDLSGHRVAVDLGGGSGYLAHLLTDFYPQLSVTVFDLPHIVAMARTNGQRFDEESGRVAFMTGNFFHDNLPAADLYILSRVLHGWCEDRIQILLNKIYVALPPGGKLLIYEKFLNERKDGPGNIMNIYLNMASISEGKERTAKEYAKLVEAEGFTDTKSRVIGGVNLFDALLTCKPF